MDDRRKYSVETFHEAIRRLKAWDNSRNEPIELRRARAKKITTSHAECDSRLIVWNAVRYRYTQPGVTQEESQKMMEDKLVDLHLHNLWRLDYVPRYEIMSWDVGITPEGMVYLGLMPEISRRDQDSLYSWRKLNWWHAMWYQRVIEKRKTDEMDWKATFEWQPWWDEYCKWKEQTDKVHNPDIKRRRIENGE